MYKFELVFMTSFHSCENLKGRFSIQFSHVKVSIDSHCENQVEIWVGIQKLHNIGPSHIQQMPCFTLVDQVSYIFWVKLYIFVDFLM